MGGDGIGWGRDGMGRDGDAMGWDGMGTRRDGMGCDDGTGSLSFPLVSFFPFS